VACSGDGRSKSGLKLHLELGRKLKARAAAGAFFVLAGLLRRIRRAD